MMRMKFAEQSLAFISFDGLLLGGIRHIIRHKRCTHKR